MWGFYATNTFFLGGGEGVNLLRFWISTSKIAFFYVNVWYCKILLCFLLNPHLRGPWVHIWYSIPEFKKELMKALFFHKFKNICIKTIFWTRNTNCFTIFVHRIFRRNCIQNCEYHIIPQPRKWGLMLFFCKNWNTVHVSCGGYYSKYFSDVTLMLRILRRKIILVLKIYYIYIVYIVLYYTVL